MERTRKPHSIFFPLLLVAAGVLFLLANTGTIHDTPWGIVATYWPLLFIVGGLDGLYKRDGWVGPLVGIGLGTVFLLGNLHYFQLSGLELLLRYWPVLLIAWGLDIAFSRSHALWNAVLRIALGILLVLGILWLSFAAPFSGSLKSQTIDQPLDGALQSNLLFTLNTGDLTLTGGAISPTLVSGTINIPRNQILQPLYSAPVDGESSFTLEDNTQAVVPFASLAPWELKLSSSIPLNLDTRMGAGSMIVDASDLKVSHFSSQIGVGRMMVYLPLTGNINGRIQLAVGELVIQVPKNAHVTFRTNTGLTAVQLPKGYTNNNGVITSAAIGDTNSEILVDVAVGSLVIQEVQ